MQTTDWPRSISRRMSREPMKPVPPITSIDMLSLLVGRPPTSSGRQPVVGGAVVPEDLALALIRDRQLEERLDRARELRVTVREVGGEDDPVVADRVDDVLHRLLVALDRHEALALEVLAGRHRQVAGVDVADPLPVLVHAPEQEGHPATVAFEEGHAQPRVTLEDAARAEGAGGQHHLDRMGVDVLEHRVGAELLADMAELGARPLVEAQRDLELLELGPQRLVVRIVPVAPVHLVRPQEQAPEAELSHAAAGLGPRLPHGAPREHTRPQPTPGVSPGETPET